jgi:hypothetical protein
VGRTIAVVGDVYRFPATGEGTNGKYALREAIVPPGGRPPPHGHSREEEGFYVLEGEITIHRPERRLKDRIDRRWVASFLPPSRRGGSNASISAESAQRGEQ